MAVRQFVMQLGALPAPEVEAVFLRNGAQAITYSDAADAPVLEPAPGETPLWPETTITGLFGADQDLRPLTVDLLSSFRLGELPPHRVETLEDRAWEREWLQHFRPMRFGRRLLVVPGGARAGGPHDVTVQLDPGLAFGTGTHPTTALALEWLESLELAGRRVLDFGCGSGILAIAALRLGARAAYACDIDPQALQATRENARRNGVAERLTVAAHVEPVPASFDVVLANILADTLVASASMLTALLAEGGRLLLSGVLEAQADEVARAYAGRVELDPPLVREGWVRLAGRKRGRRDDGGPVEPARNGR